MAACSSSKFPTLPSTLKELRWFAAIATCIKLLLTSSYRSTDFEVHRHWLALTRSLPLSQWYSDETSQWTLDYPPLFAYFERFLAFFAARTDPAIVDLHRGLDYDSPSVVLFQRGTVIVSDLVLFLGTAMMARRVFPARKRGLVFTLVTWSPCLLIVDHVHFQYNGFLLGILMASLAMLEDGRRDLVGGFVFAVLICFKHLFVVAAPVYFVYLLRHYCWFGGGEDHRDRGRVVGGFARRFLAMAVVVGCVFLVAFGPFMYSGQMLQVLRRLFPFGRGLCHAYWAPNLWVFYIISDKGLSFFIGKLGFLIPPSSASFTAGLVGDSPFSVLPQVTPLVTAFCVLFAMSPCLVKAWKCPQPKHITRYVAYAYTCGFLFGWHVHEKASLHFVVPLAFVAISSSEDAHHYLILSTVACYSLFPLLYEPREHPIKVLLLVLYLIIVWSSFVHHFSISSKDKKSESEGKSGALMRNIIGWKGQMYLAGIVAVEIYGQFLHPQIFGDKLPFLPLMLVSIYCASGMIYSWFFQLNSILKLT